MEVAALFSDRPLEVRKDPAGSGHYGAPRSYGPHHGTDFLTTPGRPVLAPFSGRIIRAAYPYPAGFEAARGVSYRMGGVLVECAGGVSYKLFYFDPLRYFIGKTVKAGKFIGISQDVSALYGGGMLPHLHFEIFCNGERVNPETVYLPYL